MSSSDHDVISHQQAADHEVELPTEDSTEGINMINIKVKTLNASTFPLQVSKDASVRDLKSILKNTTNVEEDHQRLIFRGRVLKDAESLSHYHVEDGNTLHMVSRAPQLSSQQHGPSSSTSDVGTGTSTDSDMAGDLRSMDLGNLLSGILSNRMGQAPRASSASDEAVGTVEHIRQGLITMETMMSAMHTSRSGTLRPSFVTGQWLDVRDTVNQWLEATVLDITDTSILIHYNGWPSRWDEWIALDSDRLAPFRSRTQHSRGASFSPRITHTVRDPPQQGENDIRTLLPQLRTILRHVTPYIDNLCEALGNSNSSRPSGVNTGATNTAGSATYPIIQPPTSTLNDEGDISDLDVDGRVAMQYAWADEQAGSVAAPPARDVTGSAAELSALFDRLGRLILDASPHFADIANESRLEESSNTTNSQGGATATPPRQRRLQTTNPYTQLIYAPVASEGGREGGNIDIHIHAIVAPMRRLDNTQTGTRGSSTLRQRRARSSTDGIPMPSEGQVNPVLRTPTSTQQRSGSHSSSAVLPQPAGALDTDDIRGDSSTVLLNDEMSQLPAASSSPSDPEFSRETSLSETQRSGIGSSLLSFIRRTFHRERSPGSEAREGDSQPSSASNIEAETPPSPSVSMLETPTRPMLEASEAPVHDSPHDSSSHPSRNGRNSGSAHSLTQSWGLNLENDRMLNNRLNRARQAASDSNSNI